MARVRKPSNDERIERDELVKNDEIIEQENELREEDNFPFDPGFTLADVNQTTPVKRPTRRMGGPTGGDLQGGGEGPTIGETHPADEETADHYGSREETQAALEGKIASQNTLRLHQY